LAAKRPDEDTTAIGGVGAGIASATAAHAVTAHSVWGTGVVAGPTMLCIRQVVDADVVAAPGAADAAILASARCLVRAVTRLTRSTRRVAPLLGGGSARSEKTRTRGARDERPQNGTPGQARTHQPRDVVEPFPVHCLPPRPIPLEPRPPPSD
jgi:hypothetical protein